MTRRVLFATLLMTFAAAFAQAQLPPGKWWQRPEVIRELQLSNEQQDRLDDIFRTAANGLIDAKGEVEKLEIALRGELDKPQIQRAAVLRIAKQLNEARGRRFEQEIAMLVDMRAVLNDQQWTKMRNALDRPRDVMRERLQNQRQQQNRPPKMRPQ
jgi:Spy/CpxP family protein refolding chaperone